MKRACDSAKKDVNNDLPEKSASAVEKKTIKDDSVKRDIHIAEVVVDQAKETCLFPESGIKRERHSESSKTLKQTKRPVWVRFFKAIARFLKTIFLARKMNIGENNDIKK